MKRYALLAILIVFLPNIALGVFGIGDTAIVLDPANLEQAVLEVEALGTQIQQMKQVIADQLEMVNQGAKNLLATPLDMVNQIKALTDQYNQAMADVQGIGYTLDGAKAQWNALYGAATSSQPLPARVMAVANALTQVSASANTMQAVYARLCTQATQIQTALLASKAAPGTVAATQAQTQLVAVMSDQLNTLTQVQVSAAKVQVMQIAEDARTSALAAQHSENWIQGFDDPALMPVAFGKGQGMELPR